MIFSVYFSILRYLTDQYSLFVYIMKCLLTYFHLSYCSWTYVQWMKEECLIVFDAPEIEDPGGWVGVVVFVLSVIL